MYCSSFILGFDAWAPIKSNAKLPSILESFSASNPLSPDTAKMLDIGDISTWTLDALILLPRSRLRYIKSIYTPFLKKGQGGIVNHPGGSISSRSAFTGIFAYSWHGTLKQSSRGELKQLIARHGIGSKAGC
ncbi:hypothetical protein BJ138DRAFT_73983 [Hygrophoropsis aurantiaca]|uniref:Uncharacterized protein n=1 Tax=Hygrophoropsis aurantiaca TaxID=72124 RepID=A0ACB7ZSH9_9AGAM|nr:hypothetical protein BJ138DRAFT_73983 [Hygrophoropsis aurantiaca]